MCQTLVWIREMDHQKQNLKAELNDIFLKGELLAVGRSAEPRWELSY